MILKIGDTIEIDTGVHWNGYTQCTVANLTDKTITLDFENHREVYDRSDLTIIHDGFAWHLEQLVITY